MKKYYLDCGYIKNHKRRAKKKHARNLIHKAWKRRANALLSGKSRDQQHNSPRVSKKAEAILRGYKLIQAPDNLSFINNPNEVADFIWQLKQAFDQHQKVFVVLDAVMQIDYGAIVVLLSVMVRFKSFGIEFNGNFPKNYVSRKLLMQSGFFDNLYKEFSVEDSYQIKEDKYEGICTHAQKKVDSVLSSQIISEACQTIWHENRRCQGVQRALIELMQNTNNHASIGKTGDKHWWLSVYHDKKNKSVTFSFVDFGVGIFENLSNKQERSKFYNWKEKIKDKLFYGDNSGLLRLILDGSLHRTVTENDFRGKGLPGVAGVMKRNQISDLHIISNDAYADVGGDRYIKLTKSFNGTFVYWKLGETNESTK